jgi:hypothetical protein
MKLTKGNTKPAYNSCLAQWLVPIFLKRKIESQKTFLYLHQHVQLVATDAKQRNVTAYFRSVISELIIQFCGKFLAENKVEENQFYQK